MRWWRNRAAISALSASKLAYRGHIHGFLTAVGKTCSNASTNLILRAINEAREPAGIAFVQSPNIQEIGLTVLLAFDSRRRQGF